MMKAELVSVTWIDSLVVDRYETGTTQRLDLVELSTVGFLVRESEQSVAVARDTHSDGVYRSVIVIPKFAVTSMKRLRSRS